MNLYKSESEKASLKNECDVLCFEVHETAFTSIFIMAAYGAHFPFQRSGLSDISKGRMVVSCPIKSASFGGVVLLSPFRVLFTIGRMLCIISAHKGPIASLT